MAQTESRLARTVREEQEAHEQTRDPFAGIKDIHGNVIGEDSEAERVRENEEATPPERELETDVDPDEDETPADPTQPDPEGKALFNPEHFESEALALPKIDGQSIDKIKIAFSGSVMLDRSKPEDVALFRTLRLGKVAELRVAGDVSFSGGGFTTNRDGDLDAVVATKTVKIDSVVLPAGADPEADDA